MRDQSLNTVLAENLRYWMAAKGFESQAMLAERAGVSQRTVSNCVNPYQRTPRATAKEPSATLFNLEKIASALRVPAWTLLRPGASNETGAMELMGADHRRRKA